MAVGRCLRFLITKYSSLEKTFIQNLMKNMYQKLIGGPQKYSGYGKAFIAQSIFIRAGGKFRLIVARVCMQNNIAFGIASFLFLFMVADTILLRRSWINSSLHFFGILGKGRSLSYLQSARECLIHLYSTLMRNTWKSHTRATWTQDKKSKSKI